MLNSVIIGLECLGQYEQPIIIHKIRTMYPDSDKDFLKISKENGLDEFGKVINDYRITPIGKIMRRHFIDELPQLYDLQRGVISLVGIRAKSRDMWKNFSDSHKRRALKYKPGFFGIHYACTDLRDIQDGIQWEEEYLSKKERENPEKVDREYFRNILKNILFKGLRSK